MKTAYIIHLVSDQGNGCGLCSACKANLGTDPWEYKHCPQCKVEIKDTQPAEPYSFGSSDVY